MKVAVVVQRYGLDINGGAELHARYISEHLARHVEVEVLTTCARDYITWRNELRAGDERVNGLVVRRFPVRRQRDPLEFGRRSTRVFSTVHSLRDELAWLDAEGPNSPALVSFIRKRRREYDYFVFFSFRYYHAYHGARVAPAQALLVPTAERDAAVGLSMFGPLFRGVRALMYNSYEERAMINAAAQNADVPGIVVGVGSEVPARTRPDRFRRKYGIDGPFVAYVGRIDENKGCKELFDYFEQYCRFVRGDLMLVLIGKPVLPIPDHPRIRHLGFVSDQDKFDAVAAADALIMPSYFESLSMVALEAWGLGTPVLANGRCDVLKGQCIRSNAGLYYESFEEFLETLALLQSDRMVRRGLGENGRAFFVRHYAWPVIERAYVDMFERLKQAERAGPPTGQMEPLPGWFARFRSNLPPAKGVVEALPSGPSLKRERRG
ncbi:MAG: glycosyltransferase family 4 protein [Acidobacteriota bacterium]